MILRLLKKFAAAAGAAAFAVCADAADVSAAAGIPAEGGAFYIDFNFKIPPNEHIYSSKPSENGSPTTVSLKLPDGYRLESLEWPKPTNFEFFGMKSEGYSGDFTARAAIRAPEKFAKGGKTAKASAEVDMLACSDMCVPVKKGFSFDLPAAASPSPAETAPPSGGWIAALLAAFAGGAILNLMPCVFPVIGIKILSFASHASDRRASILGAFAYSGGILASFLALAGVLVALRAAGSELGWGFQLQNPAFSAAMALLFFAMALSFAGAFEIGAGVAGGISSEKSRNKYASAALSGVLAVLVASPCTAPFMGAAVGAALAADASAAFTFSIFTALGIGMAFPYVMLSALPGLAKKMPRPGAWMETLKQILSVPLFASAIWLAWVYCEQTGSPARIMSAALALAVGLRIYGLYYMPHFGRKTRRAALAACAISAALALWMALPGDSRGGAPADAENAWSPQKVEELRKSGKIVYVDFTASWCLTCQYNKTVLNSQRVAEAMKARGVSTLVGDWTNKDPLISRELAKFGRAGVPLNLVYPPDLSKPPAVLPAILTESGVIEAVDKAAR